MSIEITAAWYGTEEGVTDRGVDVLAQVKTLQESGEASVVVTNVVMGSDPVVDIRKTLFITYTVGDEVKKLTVLEGDPLVLADIC